MNDTDQKFFDGEIAILKKLDHPNIIKIYETFEENKNLKSEIAELKSIMKDMDLKEQTQQDEWHVQIRFLLRGRYRKNLKNVKK